MIRALLLALLLTGCTTTKLVPVPCIAKDRKLPDEPEKVGPTLTGDARKDANLLAGGLIRWQAYGRGMREIVESCRG